MLQNLGTFAESLQSCQDQRVKPFISTVNEHESNIDSASPLQLPGVHFGNKEVRMQSP